MSNNTNNENNDNYYQKLEENNITLNSNATNNERTSLVDKQKHYIIGKNAKIV